MAFWQGGRGNCRPPPPKKLAGRKIFFLSEIFPIFVEFKGKIKRLSMHNLLSKICNCLLENCYSMPPIFLNPRRRWPQIIKMLIWTKLNWRHVCTIATALHLWGWSGIRTSWIAFTDYLDSLLENTRPKAHVAASIGIASVTEVHVRLQLCCFRFCGLGYMASNMQACCNWLAYRAPHTSWWIHAAAAAVAAEA